MNIQFYGAADTVTGSQHIVQAAGKTILLDCGFFQGKREEADRRNKNFNYKPESIDALIVSHAHIDHTGNIPNLVKQGFKGEIYCTPATRDLCSIMLADSAIIQERDAESIKRKTGENIEILYDLDDVANAMEKFVSVPYKTEFSVFPEIKCEFFNASHILASAVVVLTIEENGKTTRIAFTGDYGRHNHPILQEPDEIGDVDYIITESTYGGRIHESRDKVKEQLLKIIEETYEAKGKLLIPAFSVERTQDLLLYLNEFYNDKKLPSMPVMVDSPLSTAATNIFRLHTECYNETLKKMIFSDPDPFSFDTLKFITNNVESLKAANRKKPAIVIAGSGMCESGRILTHLGHSIQKARNTVLFIGFNAPDTLARRLQDGLKEVNILGSSHKVRARIEKIDGMSSHGDHNDLMEFIEKQNPEKIKKVFIVHGEDATREALSNALNEKGFKNAIPNRGEKFEI